MELEPRDGRGGEPARGGHADELRELVGHRVSLERPDDARHDDEDRRDRSERKLEPGVEERVRVPAEEHGCTHEQSLPAVTLTAGEPGERAEAGCERRADDGGMEPDRERVRPHRGQCRELGNVDPEAQEQDDGHSRAADRGDLEPVDGEAVVEACGPEVREQGLVHAGAATEDDRFDHVSSDTRLARRRVAGQPAPDAVADAGDTAAPPGHPERLSAQDHMDTLPPQPR